MLTYYKKPIFWAVVTVAICMCVALTWAVTQFLFGSERFYSAKAQYYAYAISQALETDEQPRKVEVFSSCSLDGGYTAVAFTIDRNGWANDVGAALFSSAEDTESLLDFAYCPNGALENSGTQVLRLTLPDGGAYDAVVSTDDDLKSVERREHPGEQTAISVENCPFFAIFACSSVDALTDYYFLNADGQVLSAETNDMRWMSEATYVFAHCIYSAWGRENHSADLVLLGERSVTLLSGTSNRILGSEGNVSWCGQRLTDAQWQEMFAIEEDAAEIALAPYAQRRMIDAGAYRLFCMGTEIWFAFLDENGQISCLYELVRQPAM
jgi:hypothetical protein